MREFKYNAFISYKHSTSKQEAKKIEVTIQKYLISRFKRSKIKIFRDAKSVTVEKNLSLKIENALRKSEHLIYLATPEAMKSNWVKKELLFWFETLERDELIIILLDGKLKTFINGIDWNKTNSIPQEVQGYLSIPKFIDFSKLRFPIDFNLENPTFEDGIIDAYCKIQNIKEREEVKDEARRIYEKDVRKLKLINRGLIAAIITSSIAIAGLGYFINVAVDQTKFANEQTEIAKENSEKEKKALNSYRNEVANRERLIFDDLILRAEVILGSDANPTILLNEMKLIAKRHRDSIKLQKEISKLEKRIKK